jgi:predicted enzyme related to lactoylglutathione lyase
MDGVIHFELPVNDVARAKKFYSETFGWVLTDMPEMNYVMVQTGALDEKRMPKTPGVIGGGITKRNNILSAPSFAINVTDIDAATEKLKAAGGTVVKEKMSVGDMGFMIYFKDPEGNVISLWQNAKK